MGDRHGDCFACRGRPLSPPARRSTRTAGWGSDGAPRLSDAAGWWAGFAPRENALLGEGLPTRRTSEKICPAQEHAPRRKPPDTAHERKDLPRAGTLPRRRPPDTAHERKNLPRAETLPSAKASRHGARAKGFAPRRNAPHGEGLPTRRKGERICPARERSPRRRPPDTAHGRKDLPRAGTLPSAKASRHGARAKGFAPRRNALLGEGLPTRRTSERICPAQERSPRRRPPDTAHERKNLPRVRRLSSAKASRHGARAKGFAPREKALLGEGLPTRRTSKRICPAQKHAPRRRPPDTAHERKNLPRGVRVRPTCRRMAGRPRPTDSRKNTPSAGSHPQRAAAAEFIHQKK